MPSISDPFAETFVTPTRATAINNAGTVVGWDDASAGSFMWSVADGYSETSVGLEAANDVNDAEQATGQEGVWDAVNGVRTSADWLLYGLGINGAGQIVGLTSTDGSDEYTFFYDPATDALLTFDGADYDRATLWDLNDSGLAVGGSDVGLVTWTATEGFSVISTFASGASATGRLLSVSGDGTAVGLANDGSGAAAAIWTDAGGLVDLNTMIAGGGVLTSATAISDSGQYIVGYGVQEGTSYTQASLLTAVSDVPLPAGAALLPAALAGLAVFRRRAA